MAKLAPSNPLRYVIERQYNDGLLIKNRIFKERLARAKNLYRKDLLAHYGCVNAIEFSAEGDLLISGGDDRRVLLWSVPEAIHGKGTPVVMDTSHNSNIFCLAFDSGNTRIFSGGNDDQVIIHDAITGHHVEYLVHRKPVYGLSVNPQNDNILATAGDDGRILMFDVRESHSADILCLARQKTGFHSVMFNPTNPRWLVTANSEDGIALWDCRKPREVLVHYDGTAGPVSGISASFDASGTRVLALRRRLPPVLYATQADKPICQFYHPNYYNSCTMKTCCFAGDDDEYILSGSDDFNLYMWQVPRDGDCEWGTTHLALKGHRSIVNQVRYSKENNLIASSGVEKMIKLWSSLSIGTWKGSLQKEHSDAFRSVYSHDDYVYMVGHGTERISHDYSDQSTQEDSKMLAFFDSLIQREIEGWQSSEGSGSDLTDSEDDDYMNITGLVNEIFTTNGRLSIEDSKKHKTNKIAQLIAKKRGRLAKMAYQKSNRQLTRFNFKGKKTKKKTPTTTPHQKQIAKAVAAAPTPSSSSQSPPKSSASGNNSSSVTKKNGTSNRKSTPTKLTTTPSTSNSIPSNTKLRKYRTRSSWKECDSNSSLLDAPSTSTGITSSSSSVYRLVEQDSEEEVTGAHAEDGVSTPVPQEDVDDPPAAEGNFVNILPTPLNGSHDMYVGVLETTSRNDDATVRRGDVVDDDDDDDDDQEDQEERLRPSTSSSSSSSSRCIALVANDNDNDSPAAATAVVDDNDSDSEATTSDFDMDFYHRTPPAKKRRTTASVSASDSGCGTGPGSSSVKTRSRIRQLLHQECSSFTGSNVRLNNYYNNNNNNNNGGSNGSSGNSAPDLCDSDDDFNYEKFRRRVNRARINIRKQIGGADSDSN